MNKTLKKVSIVIALVLVTCTLSLLFTIFPIIGLLFLGAVVAYTCGWMFWLIAEAIVEDW